MKLKIPPITAHATSSYTWWSNDFPGPRTHNLTTDSGFNEGSRTYSSRLVSKVNNFRFFLLDFHIVRLLARLTSLTRCATRIDMHRCNLDELGKNFNLKKSKEFAWGEHTFSSGLRDVSPSCKSRWHHVTRMMRPPGAATLTSSPKNFSIPHRKLLQADLSTSMPNWLKNLVS